jgi:replicative DNA helicase
MERLSTIEEQGSWGLTWGIPRLDEAIGQFSKDAVIILGARPGHGKTMLVGQWVDYWLEIGQKIFFESLEMTREELDIRRLSRISSIPAWQIRKGFNYYRNVKSEKFQPMINHAAEFIFNNEKKLIVRDRKGLTAEEIALDIKRASDFYGCNVFVLDHFHRIKFSGNGEMRHQQEQGLEIILSACSSCGMTPIILAQLNRGIENREDDVPKLSDLRDVGRLEEAATNVFFLYWKFKKTYAAEDKFKISLLNAKSRDGETGRIELTISPEIYRIWGEAKNEQRGNN